MSTYWQRAILTVATTAFWSATATEYSRAQATTASQAPRSSAGATRDQIGAGERAAFAAKSAGRYGLAAELFAKLIESAEDSDRGAALAEFYVVLAQLLAKRDGALEFRERFDALANAPLARRYPLLRDRLLHAVLDSERSGGDFAASMATTRELGYLSRYWILGPFDNERGGGFEQEFGPETSLDLDATYDGKKRSVSWRQLPAENPPGGIVDLDAIVRPNDQVLCFAAVALIADRAREVILHLGSDEAFRIYLNGVEVAARDVRRPFSADQDACRLPLRDGHNLLVLKICDQEGDFAFAARLRDAEGRPIDGVRESDERGDLELASRSLTSDEPRPKPEAAPPFRGAYSLLSASVAEHQDAVADAFRLGLMLALQKPDDATSRRHIELAERADAGLGNWPPARYLLAFTRTRAGRAEEKDENARRRDYLAILEVDPDHAEARRSLAELDLEGTGSATLSEQLLKPLLATHPEFVAGQLQWAKTLRSRGQTTLAELATERAASPRSSGARHPLAADALFTIAINRGDTALAAPLAERLLATSFGPRTVERVANHHLRNGRTEQALELLQSAQQMLPFAKEPRRSLAAYFEATGEFERARSSLQSWLEICPEDDEALVYMARLAGLAEESDQQRELLRSAIELNPNRKSERRQLEFLEADEQPFFAPFVIDGAAVLAADDGPPEDAEQANDAFHHVLRQVVVRAYRNGTTSTYRHQIMRVLTESGAREMARYSVPAFWGEQRARLLEVLVHKATGEVTRPRFSGGFVRLPPLAPGDRIELRERVDDLAPNFFGDYFGFEHAFVALDGAPTARSQLTLILDPGRPYEFQTGNAVPAASVATAEDGTLVHRYAMANLPRRLTEERRPSWRESEPFVRVTTYESWTAFASWWWNLIRKQSELTPAIRAKVAELTASADSELAKIRAVYRFVTTEIRYKAWEFGVHGYKPYSTAVIFERRHGDCKDKALLMNAMLGELEIEAWPVLIYADPSRSVDDLSLPMVQHFNHCISYLPATKDRPEMFLDGTATYHPIDTLPEMDRGARVLVVRGSEGEIRDVDWTRAEQNADVRDLVIDLQANGDAEIQLTLTPLQNEAVWIRDLFGNEPGKRRENLERLLTRGFGSVEIIEFEIDDTLDLETPVNLSVRFRVPDFASSRDGGLALSADIDLSPLQQWTSASQRRFPLLLGTPSAERQTIRYRLPDGFTPTRLPATTELAARFADYRLEWRKDGTDLVVERSRRLLTPRVQAEEYPEFREFAIQVDQSDRRSVIVKEEDR